MSELKRELGLLNVFCLATGTMISAGLFLLPGVAYSMSGPAVFGAYLIAGAMAMVGLLAQAELVSAMPRAGGDYFYVMRAMGPAVGTIYGMVAWTALTLKSAFALYGMAAIINVAVPSLGAGLEGVAILLCGIFVAINIVGVRRAARVQVMLVFSIILILAAYCSAGLARIDVRRFEPFLPEGLPSLFFTAGFVFVSYGGLLKVASVAEEVIQPEKNVPRGMIISHIIVTILYMGVIFVTVGILPAEHLNGSRTPVAAAAAYSWGWGGALVLNLAAFCAFASVANAGIMAASRYPLALSRDEMIPRRLGRINERYSTPDVCILATGVIIAGLLFLPLETIVKGASAVLILTYIFTFLALIILREGHLQNYRPVFQAPFYPWLQVAGLVVMCGLLGALGRDVLRFCASLIVGSFLIYWIYGRIRETREYALLHLLERLTNSRFTNHALENELKAIIRFRDNIVKDRIDHLLERAIVLDISEGKLLNDFFLLTAERLAERTGATKEVIFEKLVKREAQQTTEIIPGLAIPHIVIDDGYSGFELLLARSTAGIQFVDGLPPVHAMIVIAGSPDERNFHLHVLAAIAQIVQDPKFEERWLRARSVEGLRDAVLMSKRKRVSSFAFSQNGNGAA